VIQITPQMRILVAVEWIDLRRGIDGLAQVCKDVLKLDPFSGALFVFRNRRATTIKVLVYDLCGVPSNVQSIVRNVVAREISGKSAAH